MMMLEFHTDANASCSPLIFFVVVVSRNYIAIIIWQQPETNIVHLSISIRCDTMRQRSAALLEMREREREISDNEKSHRRQAHRHTQNMEIPRSVATIGIFFFVFSFFSNSQQLVQFVAFYYAQCTHKH